MQSYLFIYRSLKYYASVNILLTNNLLYLHLLIKPQKKPQKMATTKKGTATENAENVKPADQSTTPQNENVANDNKGGEGDKPQDEPADDAEPTSEKLDAIRAKIDDLLVKVTVETDRKKKLELIGELQKTQADETTEKNAIKKAILDAQIAEKRNAKIALIDLYVDAFMAEQSFLNGEYKAAGEGLDPETPNPLMDQMNALNDATKQARENLENALLGTVKEPTSNGGTGGGTKGETAKAIIAAYEKYIAAGQDDTTARKSVIAEGYSRGTTGAVVLAYRQEKGLA